MAQRDQLYFSPSCTTHDDSCPLLPHSTPNSLESQASSPPAKVRSTSTPIPRSQLICLCLIRLVEPIAFTQIFPYVNEMIAHIHLTNDPSRVGFYSGLAESAFSISSLLSIYHWARLSDVMGRRPVIFIGILGVSFATLLFGLQQTFPGILLIRCIGGFFSGNTAVIYSVLGEITDTTNQAIAFPMFGLAWPVGSIIGPLIGGTFSNPANAIPNLFGHHFFQTYPYFLPGFIAFVISLVAATFGYVFLEETLPSKRRGLAVPKSITGVTHEQKSSPFTFRMLISVPIIRALSLSGAGLSFTYTAFDVLFVLFCYSPIESGGLALSAAEIGICLAIAGLISCFIQLFVTPTLLVRCDHVRLYNRCLGLWPYCFLALPLLNAVARIGLPIVDHRLSEGTLYLTNADRHVQAIVWCGLTALLALSRLACLAFALSMILVKESAPTPDSLGVTNGLVMFAMCLTRSFCPALASSLFASLASSKILCGYLWVVIMATISYACTWFGPQIERSRESSIVSHGLSE
ncbi:MFS general substrate transporter [Russula earlei]|uniref:MFS general substrate transporter n=1 Tax=Russula earlei TaxID=71964 RepID=A0ACC0U2P4_9AGAM|nr:MFS general substrate transporter [Russula earlei]